MKHQTIYQLDKNDFTEAIGDQLKQLVNETVLARYRDRLVSVATVCEIHGVHRDTVIRYAKAGLIPYIRAGADGKLYKFSLADALQFDFKELRRIA